MRKKLLGYEIFGDIGRPEFSVLGVCASAYTGCKLI